MFVLGVIYSDHTLAEAFTIGSQIAAASGKSSVELKLYVGEASLKPEAAITTVAGIHVRAITQFIVLDKDETKWSNIIVQAVSTKVKIVSVFSSRL